ncbi:MAG: hypothetical protein JWQ45_1295, partial [Blastococcus sp.]|nr:hypothetical protein [Blastococcus sp.]
MSPSPAERPDSPDPGTERMPRIPAHVAESAGRAGRNRAGAGNDDT